MLGCAGDVPTLEALAAVSMLREHLPELKVRLVNVVDIMRLQDEREHPHGLSNREFDGIFTRDKPVIFAYHGYPWLIHRLTYRRTNHPNIHVRGYKEEGTTTTPFDMVMLNDLDRFHLVIDVIDRVPGLAVTPRRPAPAHGGRAPALPAAHPPVRRGRPGRGRLGLARLASQGSKGIPWGVAPPQGSAGPARPGVSWIRLQLGLPTVASPAETPSEGPAVPRPPTTRTTTSAPAPPTFPSPASSTPPAPAAPERGAPSSTASTTGCTRSAAATASTPPPSTTPSSRPGSRPSPTSPRSASRRRCRAGCAASCTGSASRRPTGATARSRSSSSTSATPSRPATSHCAAPPRGRRRTRRSATPTSQRCATRCAAGSRCASST